MTLKVKISDVAQQLQKGTTGALALMAKKHDEEVEAAKELMAKMWSKVTLRRSLSSSSARLYFDARTAASLFTSLCLPVPLTTLPLLDLCHPNNRSRPTAQMDAAPGSGGGAAPGVGRKLQRYKAFDDPTQDPNTA